MSDFKVGDIVRHINPKFPKVYNQIGVITKIEGYREIHHVANFPNSKGAYWLENSIELLHNRNGANS